MTRYAASLVTAIVIVSCLFAALLLFTEPGSWWWNPVALAALGGTVIAVVAILYRPR